MRVLFTAIGAVIWPRAELAHAVHVYDIYLDNRECLRLLSDENGQVLKFGIDTMDLEIDTCPVGVQAVQYLFKSN